MSNVLVRDIPEDIHAAQSLQQYPAAELRRLAERPSLEEVLDRIDRRQGGRVGLAQAVEDLAEDRARQ
jgi:hypothetical protein